MTAIEWYSHRPHRIGLLILVALFTLTSIATGSVAATQVDVAASELDGAGTEDDPYVITNASELQAIEDDLDAHYILGNDIDASNTTQWNNGNGFDPIGDTGAGFTGYFDGGHNTITQLSINRESASNIGLFRVTNNSVIQNVNLSNVSITGGTEVGGVAGYLQSESVVRNVSTTGAVNVSYDNGDAGGIVGKSYKSVISDSFSSAAVNGGGDIGGLVGEHIKSITNNSHATGTVDGGSRAGGLVGENADDSLIVNTYATGKVNGREAGGLVGLNSGYDSISESYANGSVNGSDEVGGLVGHNAGSINNVYATGSVTGPGAEYVGGLVGTNVDSDITQAYATGNVTGSQDVGGLTGFSSGSETGSYWDIETTGQSASKGSAIGLTTAEMTGDAARTNMTALVFNETWQTRQNDYPILSNKVEQNWQTTRIAYGFLPSLTIGDSDVPHISYYGSGTDSGNADNLSYAVRESGTWELENVVTGGTGQFSSVGLSGSGDIQIIYEGGYQELTSTGWESIGGVGGEGTAIAINSTGIPSVAYAQSGDIYYAERSFDTWKTTSVEQNIGTGYKSVGIAFDTNDLPHIAYYNRTNETVEYAYQAAGSWQTTVIDNASSGSWDDGVSLDVGPNGTIQIGYIHPSGEPRISVNEGDGWQRETVDSNVNSVSAIDLTIDDNGHSHIAYGESYDGQVKYASQAGNLDWSSQTVSKSMGDSGISIALNSSNSPRIVYEGSNENGDLMFAVPEFAHSDSGEFNESSSTSLTAGDVTSSDGTNTTVAFNLENTGEMNSSYILNLSLPDGWTAVDYNNDGGERQDGEAKWLWQTITPNETVSPSVTLEVPKNIEGTYTVSGDALSNDSIVAQADATVTVFDGNLNASLNEQTIGNGTETAMTVEAPQSDGSFVDVTDQAVYMSNNTDVATVDANGTVTAKATGTATLNASYDNRVANVTITVEPATVEEAVDANNNNQIDDVEVLQAITYWQDNEAVPRTDGETVGDFEILDLIEQWRYNTEI